CFEFARVARDRLVPVLDLRASPYDHSGPLQPLVEFFRSFFRLASTDNPETARSKIASRIEATVPELIDDVSILADFLGIGGAASSALVDIISVSRVLLILTYRPTFLVPWNDGAGFHEIRLDELRDEDVSALTM